MAEQARDVMEILKSEWATAFADTYLWLDTGNPQHQVLYDWGRLLWEKNKEQDPGDVAKARFNASATSRRTHVPPVN